MPMSALRSIERQLKTKRAEVSVAATNPAGDVIESRTVVYQRRLKGLRASIPSGGDEHESGGNYGTRYLAAHWRKSCHANRKCSPESFW